MKTRFASSLALVVIAACTLVACSKEKAVAIQAMANNLLTSVTQIEQRLDFYWGNFQPETDALNKEAQVRNLAVFLRGNRDKIVAGTLPADEAIGVIVNTPRAMDEIDATKRRNPYARTVAEMKLRAAAVKDAVAVLDKGSYFAADAVTRLQPILVGLTDNLMELNALILEVDEAVQAVNTVDMVDFDQPSRNILAAVRDGNPSERDLITLISIELNRGFAARQTRGRARDELSGRILATADISLKFVDAVENYKKVDWSAITGMMSDLSALASTLELPEKYLADLQATQARLESGLKEVQTLVDPINAPLSAESQ